jgi:hypothetical protein
MGFLDKLQFWKKGEPQMPSFDSQNYGSGSFNQQNDPFASSQNQQFNQFGANPQDPFTAPPHDFNSPFDSPDQNPFASQQNQGYGGNQAQFGTYANQQSQGAHLGTTSLTQTTSQYSPELHKKDVELILSRLDLIKSELDNINHRMTLLEQEFKKPKW